LANDVLHDALIRTSAVLLAVELAMVTSVVEVGVVENSAFDEVLMVLIAFVGVFEIAKVVFVGTEVVVVAMVVFVVVDAVVVVVGLSRG
jgi:hypothetical protein